MKNARLRFVCSVNGEYEISFYSPFMEKEDADQLCANFDDWSDFVEECFHPQVIYHGSKCSHDIMFYCEFDICPQEKEEMSS